MKKNSVGLLELETAVLECFLEKTPLSPLGVKLKFGGGNLFSPAMTSTIGEITLWGHSWSHC
jgi:hypothetical protein